MLDKQVTEAYAAARELTRQAQAGDASYVQ